MSIIDDLLQKQPEIRTVAFSLDIDAAQVANDAANDLNQARYLASLESAGPDQAVALENAIAAYDEAAAAADGTKVTFKFRSISASTFDDIKADSRPTEKQRTEAKKNGQPNPQWDPDRLGPRLIAAACLSVEGPNGRQDGLSVEDAEAIWTSDNWNQADREALYNAAFSAFQTRTLRVEASPSPG